MNVLSVKNSPLFQKKLISKSVVLKEKKPCECNVFELDKKQDFDYFQKLQHDRNWRRAKFLKEMDEDLQRDLSYERVFVLETKDKNCLGYICIDDFERENTKQIAYIETCPRYAGKNNKKTYKYIGNALLAFAVQFAQENCADKVTVPYVVSKSKRFYFKSGFKKTMPVFDGEVQLLSKKFDTFLKRHNKKTKAKKLS
ncbi:MAG: hypothetical protein IJD57_07165 [Candidatus Gastranaerophilales bacterium]|nr:hypothetical protein [Candidatus Gastranaerophilales bacterium]